MVPENHPSGSRPSGGRTRRRWAAVTIFSGIAVLSGFLSALPANGQCLLDGGADCPGGPLAAPTSLGDQWFDVTAHDYGFWIVNTVSGFNESSNLTFLEGYDVHFNTTSEPADSSVGGTGNHGFGVQGRLTSLSYAQNAPLGSWQAGAVLAPSSPDSGASVYCSNYCGSGHGGMSFAILRIVSAEPRPTISIRANPSSGSAPLTVQFSSNVTGNDPPYEVHWSFGDGAFATGPSPSHLYGIGGNYTVRAVVADANGLTGNASTVVAVGASNQLTVNATANATSGAAPLTVAFSATAHGGTTPYRFAWTFGDGNSSNGPSVVHTYQVGGQLFATVTVIDGTGSTASETIPISVVSTVASPLRVVAVVAPSAGDLPYSANGSASISGGLPPYVTLRWDWGDGTGFTFGPRVNHTYTATLTGVVTVTVVALDSGGNVSEATLPIALFPSPSARLSASLVAGRAPATVNLTAELVGGNGTYAPVEWDFGDGSTTVAGPGLAHRYPTAGHYLVRFVSYDSTGRLLEASQWVNLSSPLASTTTAAPSGPGGNAFAFVAVASASGVVVLVVAAVWEGREDRRSGLRFSGRIPPAGSGRFLVGVGVALAEFALWPGRGSGNLAGTWSAVGMGLLLLGAAAVVLCLGLPLRRRLLVRTHSRFIAMLRMLTSAGAAIGWMGASGALDGMARSPGPATWAVHPLQSPFGLWPTVEYALPVGGIQGYVNFETILVAGLLGYLMVATAELTVRAAHASGRWNPTPGAIAAGGAGPAFGVSCSCCVPPLAPSAVAALVGASGWMSAYEGSIFPIDALLVIGSFALVGLAVRAVDRLPRAAADAVRGVSER